MSEAAFELPLRGIRVVDFGDYIAGPLTGMLLADQGADVVKVVRPDGPTYRAPASVVFNRGKRTVELDLKQAGDLARAERLIAAADVLIENFRPGVMARLGLGPTQMTDRHPRLIYVSLPGFCSSDSRALVRAFEGVVGAAVGQFRSIHVIRQMLDASPVYSAIPMGSAYGAIHAATAITMALVARERCGRGERIEVPLASAAMSAMSGILCRFEKQPRRYEIPPVPAVVSKAVLPALKSIVRRLPPAGERAVQRALTRAYPPVIDTYRTADGRWVMLVAAEHARLTGRLFDALGIREQMRAMGMVEANPYESSGATNNINDSALWSLRVRAKVRELITSKLASQTAAFWDAELSRWGVPFTIQRTTTEWLHSAEAQQAGLVVSFDDPSLGRVLQLGVQVAVGDEVPKGRVVPPTPVEDLDQLLAGWGERRDDVPSCAALREEKSVLSGLRVVDLSSVLAGPACARTLGEYGADVIKVDPVTPHAGPRILCWFAAEVGQGKRSVQIDLTTEKGRELVLRLIAQADVVVGNFRPGVAERLGLGATQLRALFPSLITCHVTAYDGMLKGPWSDRAGYDPILQAATGIMRRYGGDGRPELHGLASCVDYITGFSAAFGVGLALFRRRRTGGLGTQVRTSLAQGAQLVQAPLMCHAEKAAPTAEPAGQDALGAHALQRLYRTRDGWIFLGGLPSEVERLMSIPFLSRCTPDVLRSDASLQTALEGALRAVSSQRAITCFHEAGFGCHSAVALEQLRGEAHVVQRGRHKEFEAGAESVQIVRTDHQAGSSYDFAPPLYARLAGRPLRLLEPAPKVGSHTREVLQELGFSPASIQQWIAEKVIAEQLHPDYLPE